MNARMGLAGLLLLLGACTVVGGENVEAPSSVEATPATDDPLQAGIDPLETDRSIERVRAELMLLQSNVTEQTAQLANLRAQSIQDAETYRSLVASIDAKLQAGAAPGDPALVELWNQAETQLDLVDGELGQIDALSADVAQNAARAADLQDQLWQLEDEADQTSSLADQLQNDLAQSSAQQSNYIGIERSNLQALALAIDTGEPSGIALAGLADVSAAPVGAPGSGIATGRPLVVIRFDMGQVDYEPALFSAVSAALDRRPNAAFDVAAVSPASGSEAQLVADIEAARLHADAVLRSLASMGLTEDRVSIISVVSPEVQDNEVHVFVR
jgi:hypothetical protein